MDSSLEVDESIKSSEDGIERLNSSPRNQDNITEEAFVEVTKQSSKPDNDKKGKKAGYAAIKSEYLLHDYKPTLHSEYVSEEVKKILTDDPSPVCDVSKNHQTHSCRKRPLEQDTGYNSKSDDNEEDEENDENETEVEKKAEEAKQESEPVCKKAKLKGRNKHRPQTERIQEKDKFCPAIRSGKKCQFGDNCKFIHDKKDFLEKKLPDLDEPCPIFENFGFCRSGIACRYAKSHLSLEFENIVNHDLYDKKRDSLVCLNILTDDIKHKLWKRKFNFNKANKAVKMAMKITQASKHGSICKDDVITLPTESKQIVGVSKENISEVERVPQEHPDNMSLGDDKNIQTLSTPVAKADEINASENVRTLGEITDEEVVRLRPDETKKIDFRSKLYLAPLTTVGNLPFRRICKGLGADITCGEMALASQLLKAKPSEWSLIKRHPSEDIFGVQVCGSHPDMMAKCAQVLTESMNLDFIDINCGCPIDLVFRKGAGSALMGKATKLEQISRSMIGVMGGMPLTVKIRTGVYDNKQVAHTLIPRLRDAGVSLVTLHGRSREQRYTKLADWEYTSRCAQAGDPMPVFGNGDILSYEDANLHLQSTHVSGVMIARGALIKPWIFTEIKEQRHWDISSSERFDIMKSFCNHGLEHWGSDQQGLETTRRFLLEWLSFLHRYIPVGVLEQVPQRINERPPYYIGRNDLETLMASSSCVDWIKISEMLLGPVPPSFKFLPKHKANAYQ